MNTESQAKSIDETAKNALANLDTASIITTVISRSETINILVNLINIVLEVKTKNNEATIADFIPAIQAFVNNENKITNDLLVKTQNALDGKDTIYPNNFKEEKEELKNE